MILKYVFWFALLFVLPGLLALLFIKSPERLVRWQGRFYKRWYKDTLRMTDKDIDTPPQWPWDKALMGSRSSFVNSAAENPEDYHGLLWAYRLVGWTIVGMLLLALAAFLCGLSSGTMVWE